MQVGGIANKNYMQEENWKGEGVKNWEICKRNLCMSPYQGIYRFTVVPLKVKNFLDFLFQKYMANFKAFHRTFFSSTKFELFSCVIDLTLFTSWQLGRLPMQQKHQALIISSHMSSKSNSDLALAQLLYSTICCIHQFAQ